MRTLLCHGCGHHHGAAVMAAPTRERLPFLTVDMHCHLLSPQAEKLAAQHPGRTAEMTRIARDNGAASVQYNASVREVLAPRLAGLQQRLADMDRLGIDLQVLSPSPTQYFAWADPGLAGELVDAQNEALEQACAAHPTRFAALAAVSLQHPALAARQLEQAMSQRGLLGAEISSDPTGRGLDDPALTPFWEAAESLGAVLFLHPLGTSLGERLDRYYLSNLIGQPLETTIALSQLIFGGVLDRHSRLRICAAHGGGYLPHAIGRSDHGWGVRPEAQGCRESPSAYLRNLWYDTVVYRPDALATLARVAGMSRIVAGTDYPFDMGEYELHGLLRETGWDEAACAAVLGGNAVSLLGLPSSHPAIACARERLGGTAR